jgi:two-component system, LytTR family, response regulator
MIRTVLIDDEPLARSIVAEYLQPYKEIEIVQECNDGFEGVKAIAHHKPDLIFLDIQMPKINGFEMLELIEQPPAVIFTTAFDEYAIKAFEAHAIDYLLKPFSKDRFDKALQKWFSQRQQDVSKTLALKEEIRQPEERNRIVVKEGGNIRIIPINEIHYFEAYDDYVKIYTAKEMFLKKKTMSFYEQILDRSFCAGTPVVYHATVSAYADRTAGKRYPCSITQKRRADSAKQDRIHPVKIGTGLVI